MTATSTQRRQRGATLVELMVSIVVGLLVVLVASSLFVATKRTNRVQSDNAVLQETGRYVLGAIGRELRMAGFRDYATGMTFAAAAPPLSVTNGGGLNGSDQLIVRYYGSSAVGGGADSGVLDCVGNAVAANVLSANRYFVAVDTGTGEPALQCEASSAPGAPVCWSTASRACSSSTARTPTATAHPTATRRPGWSIPIGWSAPSCRR